MKYLTKHSDWAFGIILEQNRFCDSEYVEYDFRIDFYKWSIGVVW